MNTTSFDTADLQSPTRDAALIPVPLWRLAGVELRKLFDTRSGMALLILAAVLAGVFGGGTALMATTPSLTQIAVMAGMPAGTIVAILAALSVCSESTRHTGLSTYAWTPRRGRVLLAKLLALVGVALAVTPLAILAALICGPIGTGIAGTELLWQMDGRELLIFTSGTVLQALIGASLALALRSSIAAVVIILVWPIVMSLAAISPQLAEVFSWIEQAGVHHLRDGATPAELIKLATGAFFWIGIPGLVGLRRLSVEEIR